MYDNEIIALLNRILRTTDGARQMENAESFAAEKPFLCDLILRNKE